MFNQLVEKQIEEAQAKCEDERAKGTESNKGEQEHDIRKKKS